MTRDKKNVRALFTKLKHAPLYKFSPFGERLIAPMSQGVYVICGPGGRIAHVGRTPRASGGIWQRLRNHMAGASSFTRVTLNREGSKLRGRYSYRCLAVKSPRLRALLEAYAIGVLCRSILVLDRSFLTSHTADGRYHHATCGARGAPAR